MKISVILRSHNDILYIEHTLRALIRQVGDFNLEIISIDDNSIDGTKDVLAQYPQLINVPPPPGAYNPPRTLNKAVESTTGEIVVFVNADAIIQGDSFVAEIIKPFSDQFIGAVYARQLPRPNAFILVKLDHQRAFGDTAPAWRGMFSLAASAFRRNLLAEYPFDDRMQYSEDVELVQRLQQNNISIKYAPLAVVEHSHNYTIEQMRQRFYSEGVANALIFHTTPQLSRFVVSFAKAVLLDMVFIFKAKAFSSVYHALRYRYTQRINLYRGERDAINMESKK